MSYKITKYSYDKAKKINVNIYPSKNKKYKIDVYDEKNNYITSIGSKGMNDFPTYLELEKKGLYPKGYANERRRLYHIRHKKNLMYLRGSLSNYLLW